MKSFRVIWVLMLVGVLIFSGCFRDEKADFINATVEASCFLIEAGEDVSVDYVGEKTAEIMGKYGFDASDAEEVERVISAYSEDVDVIAKIKLGRAECSKDEDEGAKDDVS